MHKNNDLQKQTYPPLSFSIVEFCNPPTIASSTPSFQSDVGVFEPIPLGAPHGSRQQAADSSAILKEALKVLLSQDCDHHHRASGSSSMNPSPLAVSLAADTRFKNEYNTIHPRTSSSCCDIPSQVEDESSMYTRDRFQARQTDQWESQFQLLQEFKRKHGHCRIPHTYIENQSLARWVKRQRHQYRQKLTGKNTTMTTRRIRALEGLGFVWDSHSASWEQRMSDLMEFRDKYGHCQVPTHYQENRKLATWVKCQRRQYKLLKAGSRTSTLTKDRLESLNNVGFEWRAKIGNTTVTNKI
ncbi:unnamed protein product [Cylindrotheca closterium]|uniref:Helicase-associated domain-containing protein n=1 Tax=Cylindrotheca closterium TaxID=2856 RepID=A0AAD2FXE2_9STRA|nr:unnamed protein product [Cylindrotheca closterium]